MLIYDAEGVLSLFLPRQMSVAEGTRERERENEKERERGREREREGTERTKRRRPNNLNYATCFESLRASYVSHWCEMHLFYDSYQCHMLIVYLFLSRKKNPEKDSLTIIQK